MKDTSKYVAFAGCQLVADGGLDDVLRLTKHWIDKGEAQPQPVLVFEQQTGAQIDFDWRGTVEDVVARVGEHPLFAPDPGSEPSRKGPGRPKLGVVCREVCLLPRHWDWLSEQKGGPSVALRRLVQAAAQSDVEKQRARGLRAGIDRVMLVVAGNLPGYEEASRALWAQQTARFTEAVRDWPSDIRQYLVRQVQETARLDSEGESTAQTSA